jgi:hypothetical protein
VFAALAVGQWIEAATGASLRRFVKSTRPIRQDVIEVAGQQLMAEHDVPPAVAQALAAVNTAASRGH